MTITADMAKDLRGSEVYDAHDEKLGKVGEVYVDNSSGEPKWVTVNTGLMGTKETFVPLEGARSGDRGLRVATDKKTVRDAPNTGKDEGQLSESEERSLYAHYGLTHPGANGTDSTNAGDRGRRDDARGDQRTGRTSQDGDADGRGMTRSEERLNVGTESVEAGTVRLRKYVVTETQQVEVPVSHEEVRLEREPVSGDRAARGELSDQEQSVTLHAERPVVSKEAHEVERVRLGTRTVTENQTISDEVRKEQIDVDDPAGMMSSDRSDDSSTSGKNASRNATGNAKK